MIAEESSVRNVAQNYTAFDYMDMECTTRSNRLRNGIVEQVTPMNKPMYCPMSFNGFLACAEDIDEAIECTPDCAWAKFSIDGENYSCAIAQMPGGGVYNYRPLKDDAE